MTPSIDTLTDEVLKVQAQIEKLRAAVKECDEPLVWVKCGRTGQTLNLEEIGLPIEARRTIAKGLQSRLEFATVPLLQRLEKLAGTIELLGELAQSDAQEPQIERAAS